MTTPSDNLPHHKVHGPNWLRWLGHLINTPAKGLELGTFRGESAEWMLDHIFTHPGSVYHCVDTFEGSEEHKVGGVNCASLYDETKNRLARFPINRYTLTRDTSANFLRYDFAFCEDSPEEYFDFIYVDAAHDAMNVLRDAVLTFDFLKPGGVMVFDDYEWKVFPHELDRPKMAIDAFLACYARRLEVLNPRGWQIGVRKIV